MTFLSLVPIGNEFVINSQNIDKGLLKSFIKFGLIPKQKFRVYSKDFFGGTVIGNEFFKIAIDSKLAKKLAVK